ncbi:YihY/virulence factor BrkB family protein [Corynebacterium halotolerans]|uniref:YihY family protein n=1 Tax=Corynebacterium halotolerans YIM 70093 = DSM 44683 TaxID=1121362 RepID=M1NUQ8_9CORY|nr:YihY/virulence factor BrkB family protein [Corynebacterium halotolerans]AGF71250.1 YihY family protein [Corynebacterium halotolerans YIM 70093 = DSM 44683]
MASQEYIDDTLEAADAPAPDSEKKPDDPPKLTGPSWKYALKRAAREFSSDGGTDLAAMLTYYTVLSLAPALLAVFSIITLVLANNADTVTSLVDNFVREYVPADYQDLVVDLVNNVTGSATGGVIGLIIGIAVALWSASAYVKAFSRSSNIVYGREEGRGLIKQTGTMLLTTLGLLVGIVLILVSLALNKTLVDGLLGPIAEPLGLSGVLNFLLDTFLPIWAWVKWPVILALVIALIAVLYYFTPNVKPPKFTWVSLGSIVAIIGIALAGVALYIYFAFFGGYSSYGAIGGVMALLLTLWVFNIMLLLGVEIDAEVERARELQADLPAEDNIQLPPRDTAKVEKQKKVQDELEADGRELREAHDNDDDSVDTGADNNDNEDDNDDEGGDDVDKRKRPGSTAHRP